MGQIGGQGGGVMTDSEKLDILLDKFSNMESRFSNMETDISSIKLILENEIRVNIQRVAEGHLDLSRNLQDAMRPSNEVEMLAIKVRMLESEIRDIKRKIS